MDNDKDKDQDKDKTTHLYIGDTMPYYQERKRKKSKKRECAVVESSKGHEHSGVVILCKYCLTFTKSNHTIPDMQG